MEDIHTMTTQLEAQYKAQFPGFNAVPSQRRAFPATGNNDPAQSVQAKATLPAQVDQHHRRTIVSSRPEMQIPFPNQAIDRLQFVIEWQKKDILKLRKSETNWRRRWVDQYNLCQVYVNNIEILLKELADLKRPEVPTIQVTGDQESDAPDSIYTHIAFVNMEYAPYGIPGSLPPQWASFPGVPWGHTSSASEQSSAVPSTHSHETKGTEPAKKRSGQTAPGDDTSISDTGNKPIKMDQAETSHKYSPGWVRDDQQCPEQWQPYQAQQEQDTEAAKRENQALKHMNNQLHIEIASYKRQHALMLQQHARFQRQHALLLQQHGKFRSLHGLALQDMANLELTSSVDHFHIAKLREKLDGLGIFESAGTSDHIASRLSLT
ncbi:MAG: hypothetical protein Q9207_004320 [Kuettlingeria erythrocarpa]